MEINQTFIWVALGSLLLGAGAAVLGCFTLLKKRALVGDTLAHAALPGITTAFMLTGSRHPLVVLTGAALSCMISMGVLQLLARATKVKDDSALAMVLSFFFAIGTVQLGLIQKSGVGNQSGLDKLLFGQAAAIQRYDLVVLGAVTAIVLVTIAVLFHRLKLVTFDPNLARALGLPVLGYELIIAVLVVLMVGIGLQLVGVVLMAAVLVTPAALARLWTGRLNRLLLIAAASGGLAALLGALVSSLAPRMPTGPWIVMWLTLFFAFSLTFAPGRGLIAEAARTRRQRRLRADENILRTLHKMKLSGVDSVESGAILAFRSMSPRELEASLKRLRESRLVERTNANELGLTAAGLAAANQLTRRHRLWELYLTEQLNIPADHVHDDAEAIEHMISAELEAQLVRELQVSRSRVELRDPHGKSIPTDDSGEVP